MTDRDLGVTFPGIDPFTIKLMNDVAASLTEAGIDIPLTVDNLSALVQTFFFRPDLNPQGREGVADDEFSEAEKAALVNHFELYRTPDGGFRPGVETDIRNFLANNPHRTDPDNTPQFSVAQQVDAPVAGSPFTTPDVDPGQPGLPRQVGNTVIPGGARVIRVTRPEGSDFANQYYLIYELAGVEVAYEVGGDDRFNELFPEGLATFRRSDTLDQAAFDDSGVYVVGDVEEIRNTTESLQSQFERYLRALGQEGLPNWVVNDPQIMGIHVVAATEGWSTDRLWTQLAETSGFQQRFPGFNAMAGRTGLGNVFSNVNEYLRLEDSYRAILREVRGPNADVSAEYLGQLITIGWNPTEMRQLLQAEQQLMKAPDMLNRLNGVLGVAGLGQVDEEQFYELARGNGPGEIFEALNDAFRAAELAEQGLDISAEFASFLGPGVSSEVTAPDAYSEQSIRAAQFIIRFGDELEAERFGVTRDDVIAAAFNQPGLGGRTPAETNEILNRYARDRAAFARGVANFQSFIGAGGRPRIAGV